MNGKRKVIGRAETVVHGQVLCSAPIFAGDDPTTVIAHAADMAECYREIPGNRDHVVTAWSRYTRSGLVAVSSVHEALGVTK